MIERTKENITKYNQQKAQAIGRGIEWLFNHDTWFDWWDKTGKWNERGPFKNQYVMARFNDIGPYAPWNVKCITCTENIREHMLGQKKAKGHVQTAEHRQKISMAQPAWTAEHKKNVRDAQKRRWAQYRAERKLAIEQLCTQLCS